MNESGKRELEMIKANTLDDKTLRDRHRDFEREAMPHVTALFNFALRMTSDPDDANDLLQETYMKAYRFWDKFEPGTNCKAWLYRIMKNSYINIYRKRSEERRVGKECRTG